VCERTSKLIIRSGRGVLCLCTDFSVSYYHLSLKTGFVAVTIETIPSYTLGRDVAWLIVICTGRMLGKGLSGDAACKSMCGLIGQMLVCL